MRSSQSRGPRHLPLQMGRLLVKEEKDYDFPRIPQFGGCQLFLQTSPPMSSEKPLLHPGGPSEAVNQCPKGWASGPARPITVSTRSLRQQ